MHIVNVFSDRDGGVKRFIEALNQSLLRFYSDITIYNYVVSIDKNEIIMEHGVRNYIYVFRRKGNIIDVDKSLLSDCYISDVSNDFEKFIDRVKPNIVNFHHLDGVGVSLIGSTKERGISTIFTVHDYWCICPRLFLLDRNYNLCNGPNLGISCVKCIDNEISEEKIIQSTYRYDFIKKTLVEKTDVIIAVSDSVKNKLVDIGYPEEKFKVIYPYLDLKYNLQLEHKRKKEDNLLKIGYIGAINPYKGVHILIDAVNKLMNNNKNIELHLFGRIDPLFKNTFQKLTGNNKKITVHGSFNKEQLQSIFQEIDILVVPSIVPETGPLVVQEALRFGVPVVGSNIGGIPNYIKKEFGELFTPGDSTELAVLLGKIASDKNILKKWNEHIPKLKSAEEYSNKMMSLFKDISAKNKISWNLDNSHKKILDENDLFLTKKKELLYNLKPIITYLNNNSLKNIAVFGAGLYGKLVSEYLNSKGIKVECLLDNDSNKWGSSHNKIPIVAPKDLLQLRNVNVILIVSEWECDIEQQLNKMNVPQIVIGVYSFNKKSMGEID